MSGGTAGAGPVRLFDYSPVSEPEVRDLCRQLQAELDDGRISVLSPWAAEEEKRPVLFGSFNGGYYTKKYVGFLSYQGREIQIGSRFDQDGGGFFLTYVLSRALDIPLKAFPDQKTGADAGMNWDLLLALLFIEQLKAAFVRGLYRQYRTFHYNDASPKGRLDIARHIRLNGMLNNGKCAYDAREYTLDNPVNRIILLAWDCLLHRGEMVRRVVEEQAAIHGDLRIALQQLRYSISAFGQPSVQTVLQQASRRVTHTVYSQYEPLRQTALLIVRRMGLEAFQKDTHQMAGLVFPMDWMWELFLQKAVLCSNEGWTATAQHKVKLLKNGLGKWEYTARPDFLLKKGPETVVLDAKYKVGWEELYLETPDWNRVRDDLYQVISYLHIFGASRGGVIFPLREESGEIRAYSLCERLPDQLALVPLPIPQRGRYESYDQYRELFDENCAKTREYIFQSISS
ncbi:hypothetical protein B5G34_05715 [Flavonifractor sp. An82]|uniref:McrC family protein n=1 Tax=Flavonifractor sp. An82 TaxID=1965660 RepID=UPI000B36C322|nr:hypothetical protein [Flavonifractor sp. An82]OUN22897.1 hypothetical protein B5G34_05715 [Flavonifractor sp. An82]